MGRGGSLHQNRDGDRLSKSVKYLIKTCIHRTFLYPITHPSTTGRPKTLSLAVQDPFQDLFQDPFQKIRFLLLLVSWIDKSQQVRHSFVLLPSTVCIISKMPLTTSYLPEPEEEGATRLYNNLPQQRSLPSHNFQGANVAWDTVNDNIQPRCVRNVQSAKCKVQSA